MRRALVLAAATLVVAACSDDGRELRPPGPDQTLSIVTTSSTSVPVTEPPVIDTGGTDLALLTLQLPFVDGGRIDVRYTCEGDDVSPALSWQDLPEGTVEVAVSMIDLDADGFVHWVVTGLDPTSSGLLEDEVPEQAVQAQNSFGTPGYRGPCPPDGEEHTYLFTLYALDSAPDVVDGQDGAGAIAALETRQLASVALAGVFGS
jgi:Raf kinase inhibitor-like YbhB/YbcL family protein